MTDRQQPPPGIDATVATAARMYDYWLGGHDNSLPGSVGYLAAGIPAGVVADRLDPWLVLGGGDVLRALVCSC